MRKRNRGESCNLSYRRLSSGKVDGMKVVSGAMPMAYHFSEYWFKVEKFTRRTVAYCVPDFDIMD